MLGVHLRRRYIHGVGIRLRMGYLVHLDLLSAAVGDEVWSHWEYWRALALIRREMPEMSRSYLLAAGIPYFLPPPVWPYVRLPPHWDPPPSH